MPDNEFLAIYEKECERSERIEASVTKAIDMLSDIRVIIQKHEGCIEANKKDIEDLKCVPEKRRDKAEFWISSVIGGVIAAITFLISTLFNGDKGV